MVNAQEWLDQNYPKNGTCQKRIISGETNENFGKRRSEIKSLDITYQGLTGSLKLEGFTNLENFTDIGDNKITKLDVSQSKKLKGIFCSSIESKNEITELTVGNLPELESLQFRENKLTSLDLSGCPNLKFLDCSKNKLTILKISNQSPLEGLNCESNKLTNLEELDLAQRISLKKLNINFNQFSGKINVFSHLVSLEELRIGSNDFFSSLENLKSLKSLRYLDISYTNIEEGLEYLSESLSRIVCESMDESTKDLWRNSPNRPWYNLDTYSVGIKKIEEALEPYSRWWGEGSDCDYQAWKRDNQELIKKVEEELLLTKSTETLSKKSKNAKQKEKLNVLQEQIKQLQEELEKERDKSAFLAKEHSFYKSFFNKHLSTKKQELSLLKSKLSEEEQEWLETYYEAQQESQLSSFVKKQLTKAKEKLSKKLTEEELLNIVNKEKEINGLENQLNNLQIQKQLENQIQIPPK